MFFPTENLIAYFWEVMNKCLAFFYLALLIPISAFCQPIKYVERQYPKKSEIEKYFVLKQDTFLRVHPF